MTTTNGSFLLMYVDDLCEYLKTLAPETLDDGTPGTGVATVARLRGGDMNKLVKPSLGVLLTSPDGTDPQRLQHGEDARWNWQVTVFACVSGASQDAALARALDVLSVVRRKIAHPGSAFGRLELATQAIDIYDNQASQTILGLNYELNWPI